jgi:hypothetical protein
LYPALEGLSEQAFAAVLERADVIGVPAGTSLFGEGRELQLYRVTPGETCVLTSSSRTRSAACARSSHAFCAALPTGAWSSSAAVHRSADAVDLRRVAEGI